MAELYDLVIRGGLVAEMTGMTLATLLDVPQEDRRKLLY